MIFQDTAFIKRLFFCILAILLLLISILITVKNLDNKIVSISQISNIITEQRFYAEELFQLSHLIRDSIKTANHKQKFVEIVQKMKNNSAITNQLYHAHQELKDTLHKHYEGEYHNGKSRRDYIHERNSLGTKISNSFQKNNDNTPPSDELKKDMARLEYVIDNHIIQIATDGISLYRDHVHKIAQKNRFIIYIIVSFSFVFIIIILGVSFLPLHHKLLHSSNVLKQERLIHATERKRLKLALSGTSTGIWDLDLNIEYFVWNNILQEIMGITYDEDNYISLGEFYEMIHEEDRNSFKINFQDHINEGKETKIRFEHEVRLKHKDGHYIWAHVIGQAMWKGDSTAYRMIGSIEDITSRKEAEIEKNIFIQGIEACNIAFGIINLSSPSRNFQYASQEFCDLTGHSKESLRHKNLNVFTGPQTSMNDLDKIDYAINEGKKTNLKMLSYRINGTQFWNKVTLSPIIFDDSDDINYYIIIFDDMTAAIEQEKQEILRQRNESLGSLAASVAHEINNLLMPMSMAKDILEDELKEDCDPFAREQLDIIVDYASQAKEIVQGILTFSRKGTDDLKKVTLFKELSEATHFIQSLLQAKTKLILNTPKNDNVLTLEAMVNSTEMKQIFTNMCRNAEHALGENSGLIEISLDKKVLSNAERTKLNVIAADFATIAVTDNGSGISPENLEKIFDPLFTTKDVGAGTGLGLSVVHGIIRSWGGAITVDSVEGKGTTFMLYIPVHKSNDDFSDLMDLLEDEE